MLMTTRLRRRGGGGRRRGEDNLEANDKYRGENEDGNVAEGDDAGDTMAMIQHHDYRYNSVFICNHRTSVDIPTPDAIVSLPKAEGTLHPLRTMRIQVLKSSDDVTST